MSEPDGMDLARDKVEAMMHMAKGTLYRIAGEGFAEDPRDGYYDRYRERFVTNSGTEWFTATYRGPAEDEIVLVMGAEGIIGEVRLKKEEE